MTAAINSANKSLKEIKGDAEAKVLGHMVIGDKRYEVRAIFTDSAGKKFTYSDDTQISEDTVKKVENLAYGIFKSVEQKAEKDGVKLSEKVAKGFYIDDKGLKTKELEPYNCSHEEYEITDELRKSFNNAGNTNPQDQKEAWNTIKNIMDQLIVEKPKEKPVRISTPPSQPASIFPGSAHLVINPIEEDEAMLKSPQIEELDESETEADLSPKTAENQKIQELIKEFKEKQAQFDKDANHSMFQLFQSEMNDRDAEMIEKFEQSEVAMNKGKLTAEQEIEFLEDRNEFFQNVHNRFENFVKFQSTIEKLNGSQLEDRNEEVKSQLEDLRKMDIIKDYINKKEGEFESKINEIKMLKEIDRKLRFNISLEKEEEEYVQKHPNLDYSRKHKEENIKLYTKLLHDIEKKYQVKARSSA